MTTRRSAAFALALALAASACATGRDAPRPAPSRPTLSERVAATPHPTSTAPDTDDPPTMRIIDPHPWPQRADYNGAGSAQAGPFDTNLRFAWGLIGLTPAAGTTPILTGPRVVVVTDDAMVGLDRATGRNLWKVRLDAGNPTATPIALGTQLFFSTDAGHVVVVDALDGRVELNVDLSASGERLTAPLVNSGGLAYVGSDHGRLWRIDVEANHAVPFTIDLTIPPTAQLVSDGGALFFEYADPAQPDQAAVAAFDLFTNTLTWTKPLPDPFRPGVQLLQADGTLVIANRPGGTDAIIGIAPSDGANRWTDTDTTNPAGDKLALTGETPLRYTNRTLIAQIGTGAAGIDAHTGEQRWYVDYHPNGRETEPLATSNLVPTLTGELYTATNENGTIHLVGIDAQNADHIINLIPGGANRNTDIAHTTLDSNTMLLTTADGALVYFAG